MDNLNNLSEIDELLKQAVDRQEALRMPKPKLHWKQELRKRLEAGRKARRQEGYRAYRVRLKRSLRRKYNELKRVMVRRGQEWNLSYDDWAFAWIVCPQVDGAPAWWKTGRGRGAVRAERLDKSKAWSKDNLMIVQGKSILYAPEEKGQ